MLDGTLWGSPNASGVWYLRGGSFCLAGLMLPLSGEPRNGKRDRRLLAGYRAEARCDWRWYNSLCRCRERWGEVRSPSTRTTRLETGWALARPCRPYSVLLPVGFAVPSMSPCPRWALTPPFHPYSASGAVCFLWHFPWGRPRRTLSGTVLPWSPDFPPRANSERPPASRTEIMLKKSYPFGTLFLTHLVRVLCRLQKASQPMGSFIGGLSKGSQPLR
jgi:hypothetical protein